MGINIAVEKDISDIAGLYRQLFSEMAKIQPAFICPGSQDEAFIRSNIESEDADILIYREGEEIVGFLMIQKKSTPPYECYIPHQFAHIMDLVVDQRHRGKGIGTLLLQEAETWSQKRKLEYMDLGVLTGNTAAEGLYKRMGYRDMQKTMRHML